MKNSTKINVRGYHLDLYGHVNNTRYLEFLEEARWNIKDLYLDLAAMHEQELSLVIVNININYRNSAHLGDLLDITTVVSRIGNKSVTLRQEIYSEGLTKLVADAAVTFVICDQKSGKAIELTPDLRNQFARLMTE
ncbi:MAG: thioesterase family protein [Candidatus Neomarinimicrobiota bacterium]